DAAAALGEWLRRRLAEGKHQRSGSGSLRSHRGGHRAPRTLAERLATLIRPRGPIPRALRSTRPPEPTGPIGRGRSPCVAYLSAWGVPCSLRMRLQFPCDTRSHGTSELMDWRNGM